MKSSLVVMNMQTAAVILGAGWSRVAGLPLAKELMSARYLVLSMAAEDRLVQVRRRWESWRVDNPGDPEVFFGEAYNSAVSGIPWGWVVEYVRTVLAVPPNWSGAHNPRYADSLMLVTHCPAQVEFFRAITARFNLKAVITTNYDLLAERSLRCRPMKRYGRGFHYGGLPFPQVAYGNGLPFSRETRVRTLDICGGIPLYKLHGSLNWVLEGTRIRITQDSRPALRAKAVSAIVPPTPEKQVPMWLGPVWSGAGEALSSADWWVVCGYSLPDYDLEIRNLLGRAASAHATTGVLLIDPSSQSIAERWKNVAPNAQIRHLPGLPDALDLI